MPTGVVHRETSPYDDILMKSYRYRITYQFRNAEDLRPWGLHIHSQSHLHGPLQGAYYRDLESRSDQKLLREQAHRALSSPKP